MKQQNTVIRLRKKNHRSKIDARRELLRCGYWLHHSTDFERWGKNSDRRTFAIAKVKRHFDIIEIS